MPSFRLRSFQSIGTVLLALTLPAAVAFGQLGLDPGGELPPELPNDELYACHESQYGFWPIPATSMEWTVVEIVDLDPRTVTTTKVDSWTFDALSCKFYKCHENYVPPVITRTLQNKRHEKVSAEASGSAIYIPDNDYLSVLKKGHEIVVGAILLGTYIPSEEDEEINPESISWSNQCYSQKVDFYETRTYARYKYREISYRKWYINGNPWLTQTTTCVKIEATVTGEVKAGKSQVWQEPERCCTDPPPPAAPCCGVCLQ
jgi:hypothetical protein